MLNDYNLMIHTRSSIAILSLLLCPVPQKMENCDLEMHVDLDLVFCIDDVCII